MKRNLGKYHSIKPLSGLIQSIFRPVPKRVLFRTDAGRIKGLSFGHARRCLDLAKALIKKNIDVQFLMTPYDDGVRYIRQNGIDVKILPVNSSRNESEQIIVNQIDSYEPDWLVVDLPYPDLNTDYFSSLRKKGIHICFIDDSRFIVPDADVVLNSSILALKHYSNKERKGTRLLLGPDYFFFNPGDMHSVSPYSHQGVFNVVISFGGSDPTGLTKKVVHGLRKVKLDKISFHVILGPGNNQKSALLKIININSANIHLVGNPADVYSYFVNADLLICAGGRTLYEAAILGVPTFAIASIDHERPVVEAFVEQQFALAGMMHWNAEIFRKSLVTLANHCRAARIQPPVNCP